MARPTSALSAAGLCAGDRVAFLALNSEPLLLAAGSPVAIGMKSRLCPVWSIAVTAARVR
jgi:hypothetical protein